MGPKNSELFSKLYKRVEQANKQLAREMEEKAYFDANEYRRERRRRKRGDRGELARRETSAVKN